MFVVSCQLSVGCCLLVWLKRMQAILNIDKPAGVSSARAVARVKRLLPRGTKVGHAGTLDPFATGVLLVLVGRATKQCEQLMDQPKEYQATVKLGATTATDDPESAEIPWPGGAREVRREEIESLLPRFVGQIMQQPPVFSALKVGGRRAYALARQGKEVRLVARLVKIYEIELLDYRWPLISLRISCGRGTYIRSLARDIGAALNVGGHLSQLRRTRVGEYDATSAIKLETMTAESLTEIMG